MSFSAFAAQLMRDPVLLSAALLTLGVVLVNGWTDAPNAIAACVATRALGVRAAILMAAVCNLLGAAVVTRWNAAVAMTICHIVDFGSDTRAALAALCAAMTAIVLWAVAAWGFGIPTSESHALIAGLTGAAVALRGGFGGVSATEWGKVLGGLVLSTLPSFALGWLVAHGLASVLHGCDRRRADRVFVGAQIAGGAATAFMHGAQDGQKFMAIFLLLAALADGHTAVSATQVPGWLLLLCSGVMALGTAMGGRRIIKSVGMDMVRLRPYQGFAADAATALCLLAASLGGVPVSTTHVKTTAILGVGAARRWRAVNWGVAGELVLTWVCTFPGCGALGYAAARLFTAVFCL